MGLTRGLFFIFYSILILVSNALAATEWLSLALTYNQRPHSCRDFKELAHSQRELCAKDAVSMLTISHGIRRGIHECQKQFEYNQWNCTVTMEDGGLADFLKRATKEAGFLQAIASAGITHSVAQACGRGDLTSCTCDSSLTTPATRKKRDRFGQQWHWGGCSDNLSYGMGMSRTYADANEAEKHKLKRGIKSLVNLHNNEIGRKLVERLMLRECLCHGVSGTCSIKTCFRNLGPLKEVGEQLKNLYERSKTVTKKTKKKLIKGDLGKKKSGQLLHIDQSPNFCSPNPSKGIPGVKGRECVNQHDKTKANSCNRLCCDRGYDSYLMVEEENCQCTFQWCCKVTCDVCITRRFVSKCR